MSAPSRAARGSALGAVPRPPAISYPSPQSILELPVNPEKSELLTSVGTVNVSGQHRGSDGKRMSREGVRARGVYRPVVP